MIINNSKQKLTLIDLIVKQFAHLLFVCGLVLAIRSGLFYFNFIELNTNYLPYADIFSSLNYFLITYAFLLLINNYFNQLNKLIYVLLIFNIYALAEHIFDFRSGFFNAISIFPVVAPERATRLPPQEIITFLSTSLALFFISRSRQGYGREFSVIYGIFGILASAIGLAGIFGYIFKVTAGYQWGLVTPLSLTSSFGILLTGICTILCAVKNFRANITDLKVFWRAMRIYFITSTLAISLISTVFVSIPFYQELKKSQEESIQIIAAAKADNLDNFLKMIRQKIANIEFLMSETRIYGGEYFKSLSIDEQDRLCHRTLSEVLKIDQDIDGIIRLTNESKKVYVAGRTIPEKFFQFRSPVGETIFEGPYEIAGESILLAVRTSLATNPNETVTDIFLINTEKLEEILHKSIPEQNRISVIVAKQLKESLDFFEFNKKKLTRFISNSKGIIQDSAETDGLDNKGIIEPIIKARNPKFITYKKTTEPNFVVIISSDAKNLYAEVNYKLIEFIGSALIFSLLTALGSYSLIRKLVAYAQALEVKHARYESLIKSSLDEKVILLKEIHHRVKNNLQIISSLLRLQSRTLKNIPGAQEAFTVSQNRIQSISLIHEQLYSSRDMAAINMESYILTLSENLLLSLTSKDNVVIKTEINDILLETIVAIPLGLIINEIITNSLKHAFPNKRAGQILIKIEQIDEEQHCLTISDNGVGFSSKRVADTEDSSFGLKLIEMLVKQIGGRYEITSERGTTYQVYFNKTLLI